MIPNWQQLSTHMLMPGGDSVSGSRTVDSGQLVLARAAERDPREKESPIRRELERVCSKESWRAPAASAAVVDIGRQNVQIDLTVLHQLQDPPHRP